MRKKNIEMHIYEKLGVKKFRNMAFKLEELIHFKDKGKNKNYHGITEDHFKYLYYNGFIHARNVLVLIPFIVARLIIFKGPSWFDYLIYIDLIKDVYCVMLQRYNYLRIKKYNDALKERTNKKIQRGYKKIKEKDLSKNHNYTLEKNLQHYEAIELLNKQSDNKGSIIVENNDLETLKELRDFLIEFYKDKNIETNKEKRLKK